MNIIWLHVHPTIIQRHITRIPPIPWSNRSIKWITLAQTRLLLRRWWLCILNFVRPPPLLLDDSFLLIFGQELFKTRPFLFLLFLELFPEFPEWLVRLVRPIFADSTPFFYFCPPSVEFSNESSGTFFAGVSWRNFEGSDLSTNNYIFLFCWFSLIWPN